MKKLLLGLNILLLISLTGCTKIENNETNTYEYKGLLDKGISFTLDNTIYADSEQINFYRIVGDKVERFFYIFITDDEFYLNYDNLSGELDDELNMYVYKNENSYPDDNETYLSFINTETNLFTQFIFFNTDDEAVKEFAKTIKQSESLQPEFRDNEEIDTSLQEIKLFSSKGLSFKLPENYIISNDNVEEARGCDIYRYDGLHLDKIANIHLRIETEDEFKRYKHDYENDERGYITKIKDNITTYSGVYGKNGIVTYEYQFFSESTNGIFRLSFNGEQDELISSVLNFVSIN